ncbi:MAG: lysophospholipid acyltransferase family protein [Flavobacteriaceae bacterium]|nr:lysophospholipid acyltransferase family protein [Flavobacteriaceae bacterium]
MHFLIFAITYPIIWLLSLLPMRLLYALSDFFYWVFYIVGYRKEVVLENLTLAFPNKELHELKQIRKKFFRHFTDVVFESIKLISISEKEMSKKYRFTNTELVHKLNKDGKSILLLATHYANREYLTSFSLNTDVTYYGSYMRINNKYFEKLIIKMRSKFGMTSIKSKHAVKNIVLNNRENNQGNYLMISDQSPHHGKMHYWSEFMGVTVPVLNGAEILAKKYDFAVVNINTTKIKRGYYESEFSVITASSKESKNDQIIETYLRSIEKHIRKEPEYYLWSHKRFKHRDKTPKGYQKRTSSISNSSK